MKPGAHRTERDRVGRAALRTEQVRSSFANLPLTLAVVVINALLLTFVLAPVVPRTPLLAWFTMSMLLVAGRGGIWVARRRADTGAICPPIWAVLAACGSLASGVLWGSIPVLLAPLDGAHLLFAALVIAGMCAGAATVHAAHAPTALAFIVPATIPLAVLLLTQQTRLLLVAGLMTCLFTVSLCLITLNFRRWFIAITETRLVLAQRTEALSDANLRLTAEIEDHRATTAQLQQAQKLEAIGRLTAGISHDFNNILTAISGSVHLAITRLDHEPPLTNYLEIIRSAAERGATLTQRLLAFGRGQRLDPRPLDVNEVLRGMTGLLNTTLGGLAEVRLALSEQPAVALVDRTQLEHAILNLVINARDATAGGGTVTVATDACLLDGTQSPRLRGRFVRIAVTDTGHGMAEADRQRAFEPFFTTKGVGKGSGLGLSHVYGLAEQSGGTAVIESRIGHGTTVMIYLPAGTGAAEDAKADVQEPPARASTAAGASVLLVEDDDDVRGTVADLLAAAGFEVRAFGSPRQALDAAPTSDRIQLIIADYAMPEMRGDELVAALRRAGIAAPALYITGYASPDALKAEVRVLHKPFRASELIDMVEEAILQHAG